MENNAGFTAYTARTAAQDCAGFVAHALLTATAVAAVVMGLVVLLAQ